ncbi:hypothetical protein B0I26_10358 [Anoxybacillus vitaminiphilus]|uniref:Uncharacterized protein n=1 Tax=Paranoxybacillus vitaminiphilus TaxID=581036 RepID=A0A327YLN4_9BACL|nr:hypothetical protein [Anoxybacillus vitaminiphilus]RAK21106.1 hypothetical protein B0I26_10358 [Anoxybacillus vitaminiphilus]
MSGLKKFVKIMWVVVLTLMISFTVLALIFGREDATSTEPKLSPEQQMVKEADDFIVKHKQLDIKTFEKEIVPFLNKTLSVKGEFYLEKSSNYAGSFIATFDNLEIEKMNFEAVTKDGYKFTYFMHRFAAHFKLPIIASSFNVVDTNAVPNQQVLYSFGVDVAKKAPAGAFDKSPLSLEKFIDFMDKNANQAIDANGKTDYKLRCVFRAS